MIRNNSFKKKGKGFTIVEVMLVVALIVLIGGISAPIYQSFQTRNDLGVMADVIAQTFRRAQVLSQSGEGDSQWGVHIATGEVILFKGNDFASRDSSFDEYSEVSDTITISGIQEVIYSKLLGEPQVIGSITLTNLSGETKILTINEKGLIDY